MVEMKEQTMYLPEILAHTRTAVTERKAAAGTCQRWSGRRRRIVREGLRGRCERRLRLRVWR